VRLAVPVHEREPAREPAVLDEAVEVRAQALEPREVDAAHRAIRSMSQREKPTIRSTG
jgi:hypothetical protein